MAIITAEVLTACGVDPTDREERAKKVLEAKYGKAFEIIEVYPQKFADLYYEVQAYAQDEPDIRFKAAIDTEDDRVSDTYPEQKVCAAVAEKVSGNIDGIEGYYYASVRALGQQPVCNDPKISVEDYVKLDPDNRFRIEIYIVPEGMTPVSAYRYISRALEGLTLKATVKLIVVNNEQMDIIQSALEDPDARNSIDFMRLMDETRCLDISFENGTVNLSEDDFAKRLDDVL